MKGQSSRATRYSRRAPTWRLRPARSRLRHPHPLGIILLVNLREGAVADCRRAIRATPFPSMASSRYSGIRVSIPHPVNVILDGGQLFFTAIRCHEQLCIPLQ